MSISTIYVRFVSGDSVSKKDYRFWIGTRALEYIEMTLEDNHYCKALTNNGTYLKQTYDLVGYQNPIIITKIVYDKQELFNNKPLKTISFEDLIAAKRQILCSNTDLTVERIELPLGEEKVKEREEETMKTMFKGIEYGKTNDVKMSIYGVAFKVNGGQWLAYNGTELADVTEMVFDMPMYMMPAPIASIEVNDYIKHNGHWVKVMSKAENGVLNVEDIFDRELKTITVAKNIFDFDCVTKLVTFDFSGAANDPNALLPMMLMADGDIKDIVFMMMMQNNSGAQFNPMMLMLMDKDDDRDLLPLLFMMNQFK